MDDSLGGRIFQVRVALGTGPRSPLSLRAFADRLREETGRRFDFSTLSLLERDLRRPSLDEIEAIAAVDPLRRGRAWLAWGEQAPGATPAERERRFDLVALTDALFRRVLTAEITPALRERLVRERGEMVENTRRFVEESSPDDVAELLALYAKLMAQVSPETAKAMSEATIISDDRDGEDTDVSIPSAAPFAVPEEEAQEHERPHSPARRRKKG